MIRLSDNQPAIVTNAAQMLPVAPGPAINVRFRRIADSDVRFSRVKRTSHGLVAMFANGHKQTSANSAIAEDQFNICALRPELRNTRAIDSRLSPQDTR
jgi:hypothetical protein